MTPTVLSYSDLRNATSSDYAERHAVAMEIQKASLGAGFFYSKYIVSYRKSLVLISCLDTVKNHGVNEDVVEKTFAQAEAFFATSSDVKKSVSAWTDHRFVANGLLQVDISNSDNFRGWMGVLTENNDP
jgi:isopenicillin N synthase-like dioxygenase